ncbi:hypothetical protein RI367_007698 [Sorochytrium milnesiophthora]
MSRTEYDKLEAGERTESEATPPPSSPTQAAGQTYVAMWIAINACSSVGIVMVNKWIFDKHGFNFATFLALIHFVVTSVVLDIGARMGYFQVRHLPLREIIGLVASFVGFVVLTNLSLRYNSVGMYQCAKILSTPCAAAIQALVFHKPSSTRVKQSLVLICVGVGLATVTDLQMTLLGTVFAFGGSMMTAIYYVLVGEKQKQLQASPAELLYYQAPLAAVALAVLVPVLDNVGQLVSFHITWALLRDIGLSAAAAVLVNVSTFCVVGKTSGVTFTVVGHLKTIGVFAGGFVLFAKAVSLTNMAGIAVAVAGGVWYGMLKK